MKYKSVDRGLTLIELLVVMVVLAIVSALVLQGFSMVMSKTETKKESDNIQTIVSNMQALKYKGRYQGKNYIKELIDREQLPSNMIAGDDSAKNSWGGEVRIVPTSNKYAFSIIENNVPKRNCSGMVDVLRSMSLIATINGMKPDEAEPSAVCSADVNTLTLTTNS